MDCSYEQKGKTRLDEKNLKNRGLMDTKEILKIDLEVFNNLSRMLNSSNTEDVEMAVETIKNLNPDSEIIRLLLKKCSYGGRRHLVEMLGQSMWSYQDLTMQEIYNSISKLESDNIENIRLIYESLVVEHFHALTEEYSFIDGKFKVKW